MVNKKVLWKVPVYSILAGLVLFRLDVYVLGRFMLVTLPDGSITVNETASLILYGLMLVGTVLLGGLVFLRNMTKKEIFLSASILVVFRILMVLLQWGLDATTGPMAIPFLYWAEAQEWSVFLSQIFFKVIDNLWVCALIECFAPYLFIPFGKKQ